MYNIHTFNKRGDKRVYSYLAVFITYVNSSKKLKFNNDIISGTSWYH